jgi:hypothetical protein
MIKLIDINNNFGYNQDFNQFVLFIYIHTQAFENHLDACNFPWHKIIITLKIFLNLLLVIFQKLTSINQRKFIIRHGQKFVQTLHFKLYVMFKKGFMNLILGYHLLIIGIVSKSTISSVVHVAVFPVQ